MFLTEYYTFEDKYYCKIKEIIKDTEKVIIEFCGENLDDVFAEAIITEEEYYEYEFSDDELQIMRESVDLELLLRETPDDSELFNKFIDLQSELQLEYIKSGYEDIRKFKDILLES